MKTIALVAAALFSSSLSAQVGPGLGAVTSADAVALIRFLERAPFAADAKSIRSNLIDWATETKDVTITVCDVLGPVPGSDVLYGPELLLQAMFGNAAYQLEHPVGERDEVRIQVAGITSMLRAYAEILEADPSARIPQYDSWLKDLAAGTLADQVTPAVLENCIESPAKT